LGAISAVIEIFDTRGLIVAKYTRDDKPQLTASLSQALEILWNSLQYSLSNFEKCVFLLPNVGSKGAKICQYICGKYVFTYFSTPK